METIEKQPSRFKSINAASPDTGQPTLHATVQLTRYDKGSAFARAMLAGLGRIHLDAKVNLKDRAKDAFLREYAINKTFAWGGIYGTITSIEDVEVRRGNGQTQRCRLGLARPRCLGVQRGRT